MLSSRAKRCGSRGISIGRICCLGDVRMDVHPGGRTFAKVGIDSK